MPRLRRRDLLLGAALGAPLVGTACTGSSPRPTEVRPDLDTALRRAAAETERDLLRRYDAVLERHPTLRAALGPVRADHAAHLDLLDGGSAAASARPPGAGRPSPSAARAGSPSAAPSGSPAAVPAGSPAVPDVPASAVRGLAAAETAAADAVGAACIAASTGMAPLLGTIAAAESAHAVLLALPRP